MRPGAPRASPDQGGASQLFLPPRPRGPSGLRGSRATSGRCPGHSWAPGGGEHTGDGKLLGPDNPNRNFTVRSRRSLQEASPGRRRAGGGRPEVRASPQNLAKGSSVNPNNQVVDGWVSLSLSPSPLLSLSVGIDPNPSPLTRSSLHLSFISIYASRSGGGEGVGRGQRRGPGLGDRL